jgi:cysteine-rich repeat protein
MGIGSGRVGLAATLVLLVHGSSLAWQTTLADTPPQSRPFAIDVDGAGDVLTVGRTTVGTNDDDALLVKLSGATGAESWRQAYAGSAAMSDVLRAVTHDETNDVLSAGQLVSTTTGGDVVVAKHDAGGTEAWHVVLDGGASAGDDGLAIAADPGSGDAFVGAQMTPLGANTARFTVLRLKASDGSVLWHSDVADLTGAARAVLPSGGDVLAAGNAGGHIVARRLAGADGGVVWSTAVTGEVATADLAHAIAIGGGRIAVAGHLETTAGGPGVAVVALDPATGGELWRYVLNGTATGMADEDDALDVRIDGAGDVIAGGRISNTGTDDDIVVVKLAGATGIETWRRTIDGTNHNTDVAQELALDPDGNVFVVGTVRDTGTRADFLLGKLDGATGGDLWRVVLDGAASAGDAGFALATTAAGDVVATGRLRNGDVADGWVVVRRSGSGGDFPCGNGVVDPGEGCDDGNIFAGDGCRPNCTVEACGDGIRDPQEECDDGNTVDGDCCAHDCTAEPDGSPCDDGNACTLGDACDSAACAFASVVTCDPVGPCDVNACDPADGACHTRPKAEGAPCDDQNVCTVLDQCIGHACTGRPTPACDDGDPCTTDRCDPAIGCTADPVEGFTSVTCVLDRDTVAAACSGGLPSRIGGRIAAAKQLLEHGDAASRTSRKRKALAAAVKAAKVALRRADVATKHHQLDAACDAALHTALGDLVSRADTLRQSFGH